MQAAGSSLSVPESTCAPTLQELRLHVVDRQTGIKFLVDSGSIVSLLPRSYAVRKTPPRDLKLTAVNGSSISTYGQKMLTIDLGLSCTFSWAFIVADVKSAISGADILTYYGLVVDLKQQCIAVSSSPGVAEGKIQQADVFGVNVVSPSVHTVEQLRSRISALVAKFSSLLQPSSAPCSGPSAAVHHHIVTTGPPVFSRPRRLMGEKLKAAK